MDKLRALPRQKDKLINNSIRSFVNITTAIIYEAKQTELSSSKDIIYSSTKSNNSQDINWKGIQHTLSKHQGRRCTSLQSSKALIFRIKCLNKLLPTRDICYQRRLKLYKGETCVACCTTKETFSHLAEYIVYQRIWTHIEEIILEELGLKILEEQSLSTLSLNLSKVMLRTEPANKLKRRTLHLRGITSKKRIKEMKEILGSSAKANKAISQFIDIFWLNFFQRLWKFQCEVMNEWEKKK